MGLKHNVTRTVPSLGQFIADADEKPYTSNSGAHWAGAESYDVARQMCLDGWSGVRDKVHDIVRRVIGDITPHLEQSPSPVPSMFGGAVNVPLFLAGVPNSMMRFVQDEKLVAKPVVKMLVDAGANGSTSSDSMVRRASALAAFVEAVHMLGNTVSIDLTSPVRENGFHHNILLQLHHAGSHFDLDALSFCLGHPAFHRYIWFSNRYRDGVGGGMGRSINIGKKLAEGYDIVVRREEHREREEPSSVYDPSAWVMWALKQVELI
jgi:hypothetical protein